MSKGEQTLAILGISLHIELSEDRIFVAPGPLVTARPHPQI